MSAPRYWLAGLPLTSEAALAEAARLRKTIALAEEALREAADHRSERHAPFETFAETRERWNEAAEIEVAAIHCRKAARKALAAVAVFPDVWSDFEIREKIEATRYAALDLQAACERGKHGHAARMERIGPLLRKARQIPAAAPVIRKKGGQS